MRSALAQCRGLCDKAGFDPHCVTDSLLTAAIRRRSIVRGITHPEDYAERLAHDADERAELLEELLVRESWFFRDGEPFDLLAARLSTHWLGRGSTKPVRILSAPCANGEEPYSIAMLLRERGVAETALTIDALDLSRRALDAAAHGCYTPRALRLVPEAIARQFFEAAEGDRRRVVAPIRSLVKFRQANLLDLPRLRLTPGYDAIFVRNVLIYVTREARLAILSALKDLLAPDGLLFVGHAESGLMAGTGMHPVGAPGAFAFEYPPQRAVKAPNAHPVSKATDADLVRPDAKHSLTRVTPPNPAATSPQTRASSDVDRLVRLNQLADGGNYAQALAGVDSLLQARPADAEAHHLRGLLLAALGRLAEARATFERALYLQPTHVPTLEHLARLLEASGQHAAARRLDDRARRAEAS